MTALRKDVASSAGHSKDETARVPPYQGDVTKEAVSWLQAQADGDQGYNAEDWEVIEGHADCANPRVA